MNLKSVAMATGLVLTFAAGAWLSTIMLAPPQRPNRVAVQEQPPAPSPQPPMTRLPQSLPERLPDTAASDSILPPLPPLPPAPAATPPAPAPVAEAPVPKPPARPAPEPPPPAEQAAAQPPEPPPPATAEAPPPHHWLKRRRNRSPLPVVEAAPEPPALGNPIGASLWRRLRKRTSIPASRLSAIWSRALPQAPQRPHRLRRRTVPPRPTHSSSHHRLRRPKPPRAPPVPAASSAAQPAGPYFTIQVGSFQDPANAASLVRSSRGQGLGSLRRGLGQRHRPDLEGCPGRALPDRSTGGKRIGRTYECGKSSR